MKTNIAFASVAALDDLGVDDVSFLSAAPAAAVPEAASWAMMLAFGLGGAALRHHGAGAAPPA